MSWRMRRKAVLTGLGAALASPFANVHVARAADLVTLRLGNVPIDSSSEIFAAQSEGFLAKAGIAVEIQSFTNGNAIAAAVVSGSLDVGGINVLSLASAHEKGLPLKILASGSTYTTKSPTTVMLVPIASPLRAARELNGKTVAVNVLQGIAHVSAEAWIDKNGGESKQVKFIELPFAAMPAALSASRVDAAVVAEPQLTQARNDTRLLGKSYDGIADLWMIDAWTVNDAWLAANPDVARRFNGAMQQAAVWANHNRDKTAELVSAATKIDLSVVRAMRRATFLEHVNLSVVQPVIDVGAQYGVLSARFPAADLFYAGALH
jgi:NitT/TauT family transport system substrate-binding protein